MKYSKWIGLFAVLLLVFSAFQPWIYIASKNLTVTGLQAAGTNFGKPAFINMIMAAFAALFFLTPWVAGKRANVFFCTFNLAWAIRNFIILSICRAGECPEKRPGIYIFLFSSLLLLVASLFPDVEIKEENPE